MKPRALLLALILLGPAPAAARTTVMADTIDYVIGWDNPASQLFSVRASTRAEEDAVVFSLPAWRPGRYVLQNYAANVQNVRAEDGRGRALPVEWLDLDTWRVATGGADRVTLRFEYFTSTFDAGTSVLRPNLAYLNPVNLLPWVEGRMDEPVRLTLEAPAEWPVATQLEPAGGAGHVFRAPDYHTIADSPTIAAPDLVDWPFEIGATRFHAWWRPEPDLQGFTRDQFLADLAALSREQAAIFGGFPFDEYHHLYQLVPIPFGHAVEHGASASYVLGPPQRLFANRGGYQSLLAISSHELFHAWNVKRIRPAALWPYDYSAPQLSRLHWWTEGVTEYMANLALARAGLLTREEFLESMGNQIANLESTPGRHVMSASLSSFTSWHTGYGGGDPNATISFYTLGDMLGLLLDLRIRDATDGARGLDDVFRLLWERHYQRGEGVPEDGVQRAVEEVAGRSFEEFFTRYVHGTEVYPYEETLAAVGLAARRAPVPGRPEAAMGWILRRTGDTVTVANVLPTGPAVAAGVMRGDVVVAVDGETLAGPDIEPILLRHRPGDRVPVRLLRGGDEVVAEVVLGGEGNLRWEVVPMANPTERQARLLEGWLASRAGP